MSQVFVSVDIEADGPIPGENSMLSLGAVAFSEEGEVLGKFQENLETLPDARPNRDTMAWWKGYPAAWEAARKDPIHPKSVMLHFRNFLQGLPGKAVLIGYPAGFDFTFIYWYFIKFIGYSPVGWSCMDIKTIAWCLLGKPYYLCIKRKFPREWFKGVKNKHTHVAVDDALEQGQIFCAMMRVLREGS